MISAGRMVWWLGVLQFVPLGMAGVHLAYFTLVNSFTYLMADV
jgi:hypothetical protein